MDNNTNQPPFSPKKDDENPSIDSSGDMSSITGIRDFFEELKLESKKLWYIAGPAIFTSICQYALGAVTQTFAGHLDTLELAAFSVQKSVIAGFSLGIMAGMGSALKTLCGQAYGAGKIDMLGIYLQRSWIILTITALLLMLLYIFAEPLLFLIGQSREISKAAGKIAIWMIPQNFAYAINYPLATFLQSQSKVMVITYISMGTLGLHVVLSWWFMLKLGWGIAGGAAVLNFSWWLIVVAEMVYMFSGTCGRAWCGFSWRAFENLWEFVKLSLVSAVMLCLEIWYFMTLVLFAGYLKNAEVAVASLSICTNIVGGVIMISLGFQIAVRLVSLQYLRLSGGSRSAINGCVAENVRVSNELGAAHPRRAKLSVVVVLMSALFVGLLIGAMLLIFHKQYPNLFSSSEQVQRTVHNLTGLLAVSVVINNIQPAISGVAIGAGWQAIVAYVNIICYYVLGIPLGLLLGFKFHMGVTGIWIGMLTGTVVQTVVLFLIVSKTNWNKEATIAEKRIKRYGGEGNGKDNGVHSNTIGEGLELNGHGNDMGERTESSKSSSSSGIC